MISGQPHVLPSALESPFSDRVREVIVLEQYNILAREIRRHRITSHLGEGATEAPWSALMGVTDQINSATATADEVSTENEHTLPSVTASIQLASTDARDRLHTFYEGVLAGIHSSRMPQLRDGGTHELRANNLSYADICSLGRAGTALFMQQYGQVLGRNMRPVMEQTVGRIQQSGVVPYLPAELKRRIKEQAETLGSNTLLTSGRLSIVGLAVRKALKNRREVLIIQRPRSNRPALEQDVRFTSSDIQDGVPISSNAMVKIILDDVRLRALELADPVRRRDAAGTVGSALNMVGGLGLTEIGSAVGGAVITVSRATIQALVGTVADARARRRQAAL